MLCILCGTREEYDKGVCRECILDRLSFNANGTLEITECPKCGSLKIGKRWYPDRQEKVLANTIDQMIQLSDPAFSKSIAENDVLLSHDGTFAFVRFDASREGFPVKGFEASVPMRRIRNSCPTCNKVTGSYYEAILQIRTLLGERDSLVEQVKDESVGIMRAQNARDQASFISSLHQVPEGIDIYLGKRTDGTRLSKYIMDNYLSSTKMSKTLAGVKDGNKFYRFTYAVRLASLNRGSVISLNNRTLFVLNTSPTMLDCIDTQSDRRVRISKSEFFSSSIRVLEKKPQSETFIVVSREGDELQLMNKKSYSMMTLKGQCESEEVELFTFNGKYYLPEQA